MISVKLPDGSTAQFPDGTSPDVMKAAIRKKFPPTQQVAQPPAGLTPGSREYADWAAAEARAGRKLPQVSRTEPTQNIGDAIAAGYTSALDAVPIAGPYLKGGVQNIKSAIYGVPQQEIARQDTATEQANPVASTVGQVTGTVAPFMVGGGIPGVSRALGMTGGLASRVGMGAASGYGISGADALARGKSLNEAASAANVGGLIGGAFPIAAKAVGAIKNGVGSALRGAAASEEPMASQAMKDVASELFDSSRASGLRIAPEKYGQFAEGVVRKIANMGLDKTLHSDTWAALENMLGRRGKPMTLSELHIIRQIAQDASMGQLKRDASKAGIIVDEIDKFVNGLKSADASGGPNALLEGISLWAKASKTATLESAMERAGNAASGLENGLRNEFRKLLNNPRTARLFTTEERNLIQGVVRGSVLANLTKLAGKFGFGRGQAGNMLGGSIGFGAGSLIGGPAGGILTALAASGARKGSEALTERAAQRALSAVSGGVAAAPENIGLAMMKSINSMPRRGYVAPAIPALANERRQPIQITVPYR